MKLRQRMRTLPASAALTAAVASITVAAPLASGIAPHAASAGGGLVAVRAGTICLVEDGTVLEGGATLLCDGGRIVAVGKSIEVPRAARVVDYGPDAVIVPGLVAADTNLGLPRPSDRTVDPALMAIDGFDPYAAYTFVLGEGITTAYIPPARGRLIAGQGAVVKLAGDEMAPDRDRVVSPSATIHGAVSAEARNTPGYWQPPVPATVDVGMGVEEPQLPRTLMGAMVALKEVLAVAQSGKDTDAYGPGVAAKLRELMAQRKPWRLAATNAPEIRALVAFARENSLPVILDGAAEAADVVDEIAQSGVSVILDAELPPNGPGRDFGKLPDAKWPRFDTAAKLAKAGVKFAIAPAGNAPSTELRFAASVASRGGLDKNAALRAITLSPAEILGVADRVGSLKAGKDADFVVFNGHPLDTTSSVIATWSSGEIAFKAYATSAVVLEVDELYVGDGEVLEPGQILMADGRIVEVGRKVGHPLGATVVRGKAAMPGMIDALGHLGLEGSTKVPATRFELKRLIEPGDFADRRVARSGVTTVALSPRGVNRTGAPVMAYKPAGREVDRMVVSDPAALRFQWTDRNRVESGKSLRELLNKAVEYEKKWNDYERKRATWTPPKEGAAHEAGEKSDAAGKDEAAGEKKADGDGDKKAADADKKANGEKKDGDADKKKEDEDKKKAKKKKGEETPAYPVTGAWESKITVPPFPEARIRLYVLEKDGVIEGTLRCDSLSDGLIDVQGTRKDHNVTLSGEGNRGPVHIEAKEERAKPEKPKADKPKDEKAKDAKDEKASDAEPEEEHEILKGTLTFGVTKVDIQLTQTSTVYEIAARPERRKPKEEPKKEIKGEPKSPGIDPELEPLRRAMHGEAAVIVGVDRADEVVACVDAFEEAGIEPVLYGGDEAWKVADQIRGRVAGVLLSQRVIDIDPKTGIRRRNRFAELANAGIPVAFHSSAEEGAVELPLIAAYAVSQGLSPEVALRALTYEAAQMLRIDHRVGLLARGFDADVLLLDGSPFEPSTSVTRVWVAGEEVR